MGVIQYHVQYDVQYDLSIKWRVIIKYIFVGFDEKLI